ncbi:TIGR01777 family oxidoreductase [Kineobactrum salinum]|uniref:TIGR01777 family protein n=1 Tax=Kineobactrum salinum TaxID=2708301 RepID=A0A6C0U9M7_9GAMM|nr:TIGR01777 family oxidoreductase [Kineobactrum salinum]QIB67375.1 TIGR01777 family protein [Kineobactrum salinum]
MHILITGGTGFIGTELVARLLGEGHRMTLLSRRQRRDEAGRRYVQSLEELGTEAEIDAVINLAGAPLAGRRWTSPYKRELVASRVETTRELIALLRRQARPPTVLLSGSAVGYYGPRGGEPLAEDAGSEPSFSSDLCRQWEHASLPARELGVRVCQLRLGVVLDNDGGALVQMLRPFRFGIASWPGSGEQYLSWIHREDVVRAICFLLQQPGMEGPYNLSAPEPVTQRAFCSAVQRYFRTLPALPVPAPVLRLLLGEMAGELLLTGQRVVPGKLVDAGFEFHYPTLEQALSDILAPREAA